jgi:hypothetical protein
VYIPVLPAPSVLSAGAGDGVVESDIWEEEGVEPDCACACELELGPEPLLELELPAVEDEDDVDQNADEALLDAGACARGLEPDASGWGLFMASKYLGSSCVSALRPRLRPLLLTSTRTVNGISLKRGQSSRANQRKRERNNCRKPILCSPSPVAEVFA